jgi:hypothetical protein
MIKFLKVETQEVDLKLIRAMFKECPALNEFYISKRDLDYIRDKHREEDPIRRLSMFIDLSDPVWHSNIWVKEELDEANIFVGQSEEGDTVIAVLLRD